MMRHAAALCGLVSTSISQNVGPRSIEDYSCGNCWKDVAWPSSTGRVSLDQPGSDDARVNASKQDVRGQIWQKAICRTGSGNGAWVVRNDTNGSMLAELMAGGDSTYGYIGETTANMAQSMSVSNVKSVMEDEWYGMFCRPYLEKYKDGSTSTAYPYGVAGSGKMCVRGPTKKDIKEADDDARLTWYKFGTSPGRTDDVGPGFFDVSSGAGHPWGYASSYAMVKGNPGDDVLQFGTGRDMKMGDVPMSWCRYAMRDMFCHIAFPQVLGTGMDCKDCQEAGLIDCSGICMAEGLLRAVNNDDCSTLFQICNRRQPDADETKGSYVPPELRNGQAGYFLSPLTNEYWYNLSTVTYENVSAAKKAGGKEMKTDAWCGLWTQGFGLARAGTGIGSHGGGSHKQCNDRVHKDTCNACYTDTSLTAAARTTCIETNCCSCSDKTKSCWTDVMTGNGINGTWDTAPFKAPAAGPFVSVFYAAAAAAAAAALAA